MLEQRLERAKTADENGPINVVCQASVGSLHNNMNSAEWPNLLRWHATSTIADTTAEDIADPKVENHFFP
jgi:hypothetical protein